MDFQNYQEHPLFDSLKDFRRLKKGQNVFLGEKSDARNCDRLESAEILHNWPSQWHTRYPNGYVQLRMNGKRVNFDIARNGIEGGKVYIFPYTPQVVNLYLEKNATNVKLLERAQNLVRGGQKLQRDGNWYGAARKYKEATELNPSDARAYSLLGYALIQIDKYREAVSPLIQGISLAADRWLLGRMYDARGLAKSKAGNIIGARDDFKRALKLPCRRARVLTHMGILEERCGEGDMANTYALKALSHEPNYEPALKLKERLERNGQVKPLNISPEGLAA